MLHEAFREQKQQVDRGDKIYYLDFGIKKTDSDDCSKAFAQHVDECELEKLQK